MPPNYDAPKIITPAPEAEPIPENTLASSGSFDTRGFAFTLKVAFAIMALFYSAKLGIYGAYQVVAWMDTRSTAPKTQVANADKTTVVVPSETPSTASASIPTPTPSVAMPVTTPIATATQPRPALTSITAVPRTNVREVIEVAEKAVLANLDTMTLDLYSKGIKIKTLPIAAKGRVDSHWETPSGMYEILTKERNHFSSIGEVNMPYSMQFYGNFFIHGWPTYRDGTPVPENYSGGCIRLTTENAAEVFNFVSVHTPLVVVDKSDARALVDAEIKKSVIQSLGSIPAISAKAYLVADLDSGEIIASSNADTRLPIASITKLMTAVVSNEVIRYDALIKVTPEALATHGDSGGLVLGEKMNATDMLYPLLMESSNDASEALARTYGRQTFLQQMNKKAIALGMNDTAFDDPSGISSNNQSNAYDLFALARYLYEKKQFLLSITRAGSRKITTSAATHSLRNFNVFSGDSAFIGGKTGFTTAAQETMVAIFSIDTTIGKRPIAIIVLGSKDRAHDTSSLLSWTREATRTPDAFAAGAALGASVGNAALVSQTESAAGDNLDSE